MFSFARASDLNKGAFLMHGNALAFDTKMLNIVKWDFVLHVS